MIVAINAMKFEEDAMDDPIVDGEEPFMMTEHSTEEIADYDGW